ncbi:relaxase/mobilization nuclease domain-containing protein [Aestuariibius sp. 2305UL40-4]|uniref:relaxase/mobilization nuclease domain-containing protein n=1 Tax=Aestuariibius violaceus TaxID=3234132 RepID=UPI00345EED7F
MILKGSQRSGAVRLAAHLLNEQDNDHVQVAELKGFVARDLESAFREAHAISKGTRCSQFLFSLSLNPPLEAEVSEEAFRKAANEAGQRLGLQDQPRALVFHEKEGRRHAHVVWSRIDADSLKAINLPFYKTRLRDLAKELYLDHGWNLPQGLQVDGGKNPFNFTLAEWQRAKRQGVDPREIKQLFRDAWERSDNLTSLSNALEERGYLLAKGDRRSVVALDRDGEIYSFARMAGVRAKVLKERFGETPDLPSLAMARAQMKARVTDQLKSFIQQVKERHADQMQPFAEEKADLVVQHRAERKRLKEKQAERWETESVSRANRLRGGLRGLFDRLTGTARETRARNEAEAWRCLKRDQAQREALIAAQMQDRRGMQSRIDALRARQKDDRRILARDIGRVLKARARNAQAQRQERSQRRRRDRGPDLSR